MLITQSSIASADVRTANTCCNKRDVAVLTDVRMQSHVSPVGSKRDFYISLT